MVAQASSRRTATLPLTPAFCHQEAIKRFARAALIVYLLQLVETQKKEKHHV
jgi:hypothetical protein